MIREMDDNSFPARGSRFVGRDGPWIRVRMRQLFVEISAGLARRGLRRNRAELQRGEKRKCVDLQQC